MAITPVAQFAALADATRCRVVELLQERPRPVHELAAAFEISRPAISLHLRVLKDAELVREEKRGRENVYALDIVRLDDIKAWLGELGSPKRIVPKGRTEKFDLFTSDLFAGG